MEVFGELRSSDNKFAFSFIEAGTYVEVTCFTVNNIIPVDKVVMPFVFASYLYHGLISEGYIKRQD